MFEFVQRRTSGVGARVLGLLCLLAAASSHVSAQVPATGDLDPYRLQTGHTTRLARDLDGDGRRDIAIYKPLSMSDREGPGRVWLVKWGGAVKAPLAVFEVESKAQMEVFTGRHPIDVNDDQVVDAKDITSIVPLIGTTTSPRGPGDIDGDGEVTTADLHLLQWGLREVRGRGWIDVAGYGNGGCVQFENGTIICRGIGEGGPGGESGGGANGSGAPGDDDGGFEGDGGDNGDSEPPENCDIEFVPDAMTHLAGAEAVMVLPGDTEHVTAQTFGPCPDAGEITYRIITPSLAKFRDGDELVDEITGGANELLDVVGLSAGQTVIRAYSSDGAQLGTISVKVGGTLTVRSQTPPTFTPYYSGAPVGPSGRILPPSIYQAAAATPDEPCDIRLTIVDRDGNPKPGIAVVAASRDSMLFSTERSIYYSGDDGRSYLALEVDYDHFPQTPSTVSYITENVAFLLGDAAEQLDGMEVPDGFRESKRFIYHKFNGSTLYFAGPLTGDGTEHPITGLSLDVGLVNKIDLQILRTALERRTYQPEGWVDFSKVLLPLWDPDTDSIALQPGGEELGLLTGSPGELLFPSAAQTFLLDYLEQELTPLLSPQFSAGYVFVIAPSMDEEEGVLLPALVTAEAIAKELAIAFTPGGDIVDLIRYAIGEGYRAGGPTTLDHWIAAMSAAGLAADAGYFFGPAGLLTNAVPATAKAIFRFCDLDLVRAMMHLGDGAIDSARILIGYLATYPFPPGFNPTSLVQVTQWCVDLATSTINQWRRTLFSAIGLEATHLSETVGVFAARATRTYSDEAAEGGAFLVKIGRKSTLEALYDDFPEDIIEQTLTHATALGRRGFSELSDDAVRGLAVATEAVGPTSSFIRDITNGTELTQERAELLFGNLPAIQDVTGLDRLVRYFRNNASNPTGFDGAIFEGTVARRIYNGEIPNAHSLTEVSNDGLAGFNRIDTRTSSHGIQIKHKTADAHFVPSDIKGGGLSGLPYLLNMKMQAMMMSRLPMLIINRQPSPDLQDMLLDNGIDFAVVAR